MTLPIFIISIISCLLLSWLSTSLIRRYLVSKAILDMPNERSSHSTPTPRGGGLAVSGLSIIIWGIYAAINGNNLLWIPILCSILLAAISWVDDLISLSAAKRLLLQLIATFCGYFWISQIGSVSQNLLPLWAEWIVFSVVWTGFVNFFNFMDGIDGISGVEASAIGFGIFVVLGFDFTFENDGILGLYMAVICLGFLILNWHPARIFLGDVGSVPLGYLLGGLLLNLAATGNWAAAIILPLYYFTDASLTLFKRLLRGEKIWQAHKEHYYQQATQKGYSHATVSVGICIANLILMILAFYSIHMPYLTLGLGVLTVTSLLFWMKK